MPAPRPAITALAIVLTAAAARPASVEAQQPRQPRGAPAAPPAAAPATAPAAASADSLDTIALQVDPHTGRVTALSDSDASKVRRLDGRSFRLRKRAQVALHVVNTNTAAYTITVTDSANPAVPGTTNVVSLENIIGTYKSYFPQVAAALSSAHSRGLAFVSQLPDVPPSADAHGPIARAILLGKAMEPDVYAADSIIGPRGLVTVGDAISTATSRMSGNRPESVAADFRRQLHLPGKDCDADTVRYGFADSLLVLQQAIRPRYDSLTDLLANPAVRADPAIHDTLQWFASRTDSIVRKSQSMAPRAAQLDRLAAAVATACSYHRFAPRTIDASEGRTFYVTIRPRTDDPLKDAADDGPIVTTVKVLAPRPLFVPSIGLSALFAPQAKFDSYSTRQPATSAGGKVEIYPTKPVDARYSWGVTVGASWRPLDWREQNGVALWLPELTVQPSPSSGGGVGAAVGAALSYNVVKLGAGVLWAQHPVLVGQSVGDLLPNSNFLQTRDGYGTGRVYVSLSVFDVSSLLPSGK